MINGRRIMDQLFEHEYQRSTVKQPAFMQTAELMTHTFVP